MTGLTKSFDELFGRLWSTEEVALCLVASEAAESVELVRCFNTFTNRLQS